MKTLRFRHIVRLWSLSCGLLVMVLLAHHAHGKENPIRPLPKRDANPDAPSDPERRFFEEARKYLGCRYQSGGSTSSGFDCSGFVRFLYKKILDIELPRTSSEQHQMTSLQTVSSSSLKTGDLIFFSSGRKRKIINHVGIYLSEGKFISATRKGVVISDLNEPYWQARNPVVKRIAGDRFLPGMGPRESLSSLSYAFNESHVLSLLSTEAEMSRSDFSRTAYHLSGDFHGIHRGISLGYTLAPNEQPWAAYVIAFRDYYIPRETDLTGDSDRFAFRAPSSYDLFEAPYVEGIRIVGEVRPSDWLSISPSMVYFTKINQMKEPNLPKLLLGLDVVLASSEEGWSLSTALQYPLRQFSTAFVSKAWEDQSFDLSLTYRHWLTSTMQLSLAGENLMKLSPKAQEVLSRSEREAGRFTLVLNFFY